MSRESEVAGRDVSDGSNDRPGVNAVVLEGVVSSRPRQVDLASGSSLVRIELTTRLDRGAAASVPIVWFDPRWLPDEGDRLVVLGHVRRRFYRAAGVTRSSTEVEAHRVVPARRRREVDRAIDRVMRGILRARDGQGPAVRAAR